MNYKKINPITDTTELVSKKLPTDAEIKAAQWNDFFNCKEGDVVRACDVQYVFKNEIVRNAKLLIDYVKSWKKLEQHIYSDTLGNFCYAAEIRINHILENIEFIKKNKNVYPKKQANSSKTEAGDC